MIKAIIMIVYFISLYFILFWLLVFLEKGVKGIQRHVICEVLYVSLKGIYGS